MDTLWAPWRMKYIKTSANIPGRKKSCVFCKAAKPKAQDYVVFKTGYSIALLNIFPYNNGHTLVSPIRHIRKLSQLKEMEALDLFKAITKAKRLLDKVLKPDGYNIGINVSKSAGAGITGHLHIHIVPRWIGDTNFISTVYNTRIIYQSLNELLKRLKNAESKTD